jgi:hypothetical protein
MLRAGGTARNSLRSNSDLFFSPLLRVFLYAHSLKAVFLRCARFLWKLAPLRGGLACGIVLCSLACGVATHFWLVPFRNFATRLRRCSLTLVPAELRYLPAAFAEAYRSVKGLVCLTMGGFLLWEVN